MLVEEAIATCHGQSPMEAGLPLMMLAEASGEAVADPAGPSVEIRATAVAMIITRMRPLAEVMFLPVDTLLGVHLRRHRDG